MSDYEDCERCGWRGPIGFHPTPEACIKTLVDANLKGNAEEFRLEVAMHAFRARARRWKALAKRLHADVPDWRWLVEDSEKMGIERGAAIAFGIVGMFEAIQSRCCPFCGKYGGLEPRAPDGTSAWVCDCARLRADAVANPDRSVER